MCVYISVTHRGAKWVRTEAPRMSARLSPRYVA